MPYTTYTNEFYHDFAIGDVVRWKNRTEQSYEILDVILFHPEQSVYYDVRGLDDGTIYTNINIAASAVEKVEPRRLGGIELVVKITDLEDDPDVRLKILDQFKAWVRTRSELSEGTWSDGTYIWLDQNGEVLV